MIAVRRPPETRANSRLRFPSLSMGMLPKKVDPYLHFR